MLILRRSNCIVTASCIDTLVSSHTVRRLRADLTGLLSTSALYGCLWRVMIPDAVTIEFDLLRMSIVLLETCRRLYCNVIYIYLYIYIYILL